MFLPNTTCDYFDNGHLPETDSPDLAADLATNHVYVPNKEGTCFEIVFVEVLERGKASSFKRVYLERKSIPWPSEQL